MCCFFIFIITITIIIVIILGLSSTNGREDEQFGFLSLA
jgi:hypothetical protein